MFGVPAAGETLALRGMATVWSPSASRSRSVGLAVTSVGGSTERGTRPRAAGSG